MSDPRRALVVDDEYTIRYMLERAMSSAGWSVVTAGDAEAASELLATEYFDLLLLDKNLPVMSGIDLLREVRRVDRRIRCVVITGFASAESAEEACAIGVDGYIEKPFKNVFAVVKRLGELVDSPRRAPAATPVSDHSDTQTSSGSRRPSPQALRASVPPSSRALVVGASASTLDSVREALGGLFLGGIENVELDQCLEKMVAAPPRVCVVDAAVGWSNVVDLLRTARDSALPVDWVVLKASAPTFEVVTELIDLEVRVLLDKPVDPGLLATRVDYLLALG